MVFALDICEGYLALLTTGHGGKLNGLAFVVGHQSFQRKRLSDSL